MQDKKDIPRETNPCNCLVVGSLWADPVANVKQLVNSFISLTVVLNKKNILGEYSLFFKLTT